MRDIVDHYAGRGYRALDLGIGSMTGGCCKDDEPIFGYPSAQPARRVGGGGNVGRQPRQASGEAQWRCSSWRRSCGPRFTADPKGRRRLDRATIRCGFSIDLKRL
jgi:hypothetical protein